MTYKFSKKAQNYKRKPITARYCKEVALDMIVNTMKIEKQPVSRSKLKKLIEKNGSNSRRQRN